MLFPTSVVGNGSAKQLYDSYALTLQTAAHYENLWSAANIIYILISVIGAVVLSATTLAVTEKRLWLKGVNFTLALVVALASGLNAAFRFADTAKRYGDFMVQLQTKSTEYLSEHDALNVNGSINRDEEKKLTIKYAKVLSAMTNDMNSIRTHLTTAVRCA